MKLKLLLIFSILLMYTNIAISDESINVGNKVCPISGEDITSMGDGKGIQIEHEGKIYNLCCAMCAKDFKKDPEKFIKIINEELEAGEYSEHEEHGDYEEDGGHDHQDHDH